MPAEGPYDQRLGYAQLRVALPKLAAAGFEVSAQARQSERFRQITGRGLNPIYREKSQAGLTVLYCVGETAGEQEHWQEVLKSQLETGLKDVDKEKVVIAYEPIWAIGPGKTPPDEAYITKIGTYIKEMTGGMDVVYGGGLKTDNARMLASVPVMDGGLIALTRFQGQIGFYPEEYLEIVRTYLERD